MSKIPANVKSFLETRKALRLVQQKFNEIELRLGARTSEGFSIDTLPLSTDPDKDQDYLAIFNDIPDPGVHQKLKLTELLDLGGAASTTAYTPEDPLHWHEEVPTEVQRALDILGKDVDVMEHSYDGAIIETVNVDVQENSGAVELLLEQSGGGDLTCRFAGASHTLDTTPVLAVTLTAGTDIAPTLNYVYVLESSGVLTLTASTAGWPSGPHCPVARVFVPSAALVASDGAYMVHVSRDHIRDTTENGHLSHINRKLRAQHADWDSGVAPSDLDASSPPDAYISTTAGIILQLHPHTMPAFDMEAGDPLYVVNDPDVAYTPITSFDDITQDASGNTSINNKYMVFVLFGVVSEDQGECKLYLNLPTDIYTVAAVAIADESQTAVYSMPAEFTGTAFLIARYTLQAKTSGTWVQSAKVDLRGLKPSSAAGGGSTVNAVTAAATIADNAITRGDGGARGIQSSTATIGDDGVMLVPGLGTGALGAYDLRAGNVSNYGIIGFGDALIGRTSHNAGDLDLNGAVIIRNMGGPVSGEIEFVFTESAGGGVIRFAIPKSAVGNATYNPRSMLIIGPAVNNDDIVTIGYWNSLGFFLHLPCDTGGSGADLGVQNNIEFHGTLYGDNILESTTDAGVTIEGVLVKDGTVRIEIDDADAFAVAPAAGANTFHVNTITGGIFTDEITPYSPTAGDIGSSTRKYFDLFLANDINVGGTVDGRDVAADGTTLDGMEALAIAYAVAL